MTDEAVPTAAERWASSLEAWALPPHVVTAAPASPWHQDVASFSVDATIDRTTLSARWAREVLPAAGGTVLDVGCGGGRSSLPLVPPASELIGVDRRGAMLDAFVDAAANAGVARRTVHGSWPDVAGITPVADVAICHHVVYDVAELVPFLVALTARARLAVVVELPVRHPMSAWNEGFAHFWQIDRPTRPVLADFVDVVRELGFDPEYAVGPHRRLSAASADPSRLLPTARRRLALSPDRDGELADWLAAHPPAFVDEVGVVRWAGAGEV